MGWERKKMTLQWHDYLLLGAERSWFQCLLPEMFWNMFPPPPPPLAVNISWTGTLDHHYECKKPEISLLNCIDPNRNQDRKATILETKLTYSNSLSYFVLKFLLFFNDLLLLLFVKLKFSFRNCGFYLKKTPQTQKQQREIFAVPPYEIWKGYSWDL